MNDYVCRFCHQAKWPNVHLKYERWYTGECRICGEEKLVCFCPDGEHDKRPIPPRKVVRRA